MSDVSLDTVSGQGRGSGDSAWANRRNIFLEQFSGLVLGHFNAANVTMNRHTVRNISSGKSAQFPVTGIVDSYFHTPGKELTFDNPQTAAKTIVIQQLLVASVFQDILDDAMSHFETKNEYAKQCAEALAAQMDQNVLTAFSKAARSATNLSSDNAGGEGEIVTGAAAGDINTSAELLDALLVTARLLDEKNIPDAGRQVFVAPLQWYLLINDDNTSKMAAHLDRTMGGEGSRSGNIMPRIAGMEIVKTNHMPQGQGSSGVINNSAGEFENLDGDYSDVIALVNVPAAVGTVKLLDLKTESQYDLRRQGDIYLAKMAAGTDVLRPECSIEVSNVGASGGDLDTDMTSGGAVNYVSGADVSVPAP